MSVAEASQSCGRFTEENSPDWRQSTYLFPQVQLGSVGFSAYVNQKMNRPMACTYLLFLLHDPYLYVRVLLLTDSLRGFGAPFNR